MKKLICLISFIFCGAVQAAGTVDFLKIDKDIVLFSTTEEKVSSPACVSTENTDNWAVSLKSESGRAIYSLLVTAMAKELALEVDSAGDCADVEGLERASGVNLVMLEAQSQSRGTGISVYKGDGITRLGPLVQVHDADHFTLFYVQDDSVKRLNNTTPTNVFFYFLGANCTGEPYTDSSSVKVRNLSYKEGITHQKVGAQAYRLFNWRLDNSGNCTNQTYSNVVSKVVTEYVDPVCGNKPCIVKED